MWAMKRIALGLLVALAGCGAHGYDRVQEQRREAYERERMAAIPWSMSCDSERENVNVALVRCKITPGGRAIDWLQVARRSAKFAAKEAKLIGVTWIQGMAERRTPVYSEQTCRTRETSASVAGRSLHILGQSMQPSQTSTANCTGYGNTVNCTQTTYQTPKPAYVPMYEQVCSGGDHLLYVEMETRYELLDEAEAIRRGGQNSSRGSVETVMAN